MSLLLDKEFTLTASPCHTNNEPIIDSLEVYSQTKDNFQWKQKIDELSKSVQALESSKKVELTVETVLLKSINTLISYYSQVFDF